MTKFFIAAITAVALVGAATTSAFAKPQGNGNHHHHNHWNGGGIYIVGNSYDEPECYMVTKYSRQTGRPYLVEVCS
jgi:hypothetical protein